MRLTACGLLYAALTLIGNTGVALAQQSPAESSTATVCGLPIPPPAKDPPPNTAPVVFQIVPCFSKQGNVSMVEPETYLYYIHMPVSRPSQNIWVPYDASVVESVREDFRRLWDTGFLDDLSIEATDYRFPNGVVGKLMVYNMEERPRVKVVTYEGAKHLDQSKLEEKLREMDLSLRLDSFVDPNRIAKVKTLAADMLGAQGYTNAQVTPTIEPLPGGPKLVHLRFSIDEGPKTRIEKIEFEGNAAFSDRALAGAMKNNQTTRLFPVPKFDSTYRQEGFEEDADRVTAYYHDRGYVMARVGEPRIETLKDSKDRKTRWVALKIPVTEGLRYRVADLKVEGATDVKAEYLLTLFKLRSGDIYSEQRIRDGLNKARELYGSIGRFEFTGYPELSHHDDPDDPRIDVTLQLHEGERFFVNRITFVGNTHTRDNVIRRELRVYEGGVLDMEALKLSIRRLNQLGYFKTLDEAKAIDVEKLPNQQDKVDLTLKVDEQNRNQISFGAGMSEINGLFVNGSYATSNFLGKGETLSVSAQRGLRGNDYEAGLTEPYIFNRPMSLGANLFSRKNDYYYLSATAPTYSEVREGATATVGWNLRAFTRVFGGYTREIVDTLTDPSLKSSASSSAENTSSTVTTTLTRETATGGTSTVAVTTVVPPTLDFSVDDGRHVESRVEPTVAFDTVNAPFAPRRGVRLTLNGRLAGGWLGGTTDYWRPDAELIWYIPQAKRTAFGLRGQMGYLRPYGATDKLPYYLRYFLGGEYQIRGVDLRTVGPINKSNQLVGGNKFVLFNAEYYVDMTSFARALVFHDAGQAFDDKAPIDLRQLRTSTGVELRVMVPMLNVPFRLIYAWNFYRDSFQKPRTLKFAVGTTF